MQSDSRIRHAWNVTRVVHLVLSSALDIGNVAQKGMMRPVSANSVSLIATESPARERQERLPLRSFQITLQHSH